ncbi:redoxin domain-containing protein [Thiosocius teredinicola]|uniref:redoxin domain-containing protein n=1 Tax=Thiosocius teredinicola TaxID=1973002 RepID=UPI0009913DA7
MWKSIAVAGLIAGLNASAYATATVGEPAPEFAGTDTQGKQHRLSDYRGKTVVLEWTNHDCPYVRKHYGSGNMQAQQKAATDAGVVWLSIISSAQGKQGHVRPAQADALTESRNASPSSVILDTSGDIGRVYGAKTTPHMYIVNGDGTLVYKGGIDSIPTSNPDDIANAKQYVKVALDELAAGQPIADAVTRPYGCSVKY